MGDRMKSLIWRIRYALHFWKRTHDWGTGWDFSEELRLDQTPVDAADDDIYYSSN